MTFQTFIYRQSNTTINKLSEIFIKNRLISKYIEKL